MPGSQPNNVRMKLSFKSLRPVLMCATAGGAKTARQIRITSAMKDCIASSLNIVGPWRGTTVEGSGNLERPLGLPESCDFPEYEAKGISSLIYPRLTHTHRCNLHTVRIRITGVGPQSNCMSTRVPQAAAIIAEWKLKTERHKLEMEVGARLSRQRKLAFMPYVSTRLARRLPTKTLQYLPCLNALDESAGESDWSSTLADTLNYLFRHAGTKDEVTLDIECISLSVVPQASCRTRSAAAYHQSDATWIRIVGHLRTRSSSALVHPANLSLDDNAGSRKVAFVIQRSLSAAVR